MMASMPVDQEIHRRIEQKLQEACAALLRAGINIAVIAHTMNNYVIHLWREEVDRKDAH